MAFRLNKLFSNGLISGSKNFVRHKSQRRSLGKDPTLARNLEQRLQEINYKDPSIHYKVNIGYALPRMDRKEVVVEHVKVLKDIKANKELSTMSRDAKLLIPLDEVAQEWDKTLAPSHIRTIAEHYAIYEHLFGDAYFHPVVPLSVRYPYEDFYVPVFRGNSIKPAQALSPPEIAYESDKNSLWSLILTTPDGHLTSENMEYVHWFIGNIPGNDIQRGDVVHNYIQPLPLKGLGFLRYVLILYKQDKKIDFSDIKTQGLSDLNQRSFSSLEFYRKHQDYLTPAGLSFFTSDWDDTVKDFYSKTLNSDCPEFIYDFPEHYYKKQVWFPLKQPFNLYLDRYRDEKEIAKERLVKKLQKTDPFTDPSKVFKMKYPNAVPFKKGTPSWLKTEIIKERLGWARAKDEL